MAKINIRGSVVQSATLDADVEDATRQLCRFVLDANQLPSNAYVDARGRIVHFDRYGRLEILSENPSETQIQALRVCEEFKKLVETAVDRVSSEKA